MWTFTQRSTTYSRRFSVSKLKLTVHFWIVSPDYPVDDVNGTHRPEHRIAVSLTPLVHLSLPAIIQIAIRHPRRIDSGIFTSKRSLEIQLVIKFPTRNRPDKFKNVFTRYLTFLSGRHDVRFILSMDEDDLTMNNSTMQTWIATRARCAQIEYFYGQSKTKIEACNANLVGVNGDVLMLASDDMVPVQMGYDDIIARVFAEVFPNYDGAVKFWDGLRPKEDPLMTLTVMGFPLYKRFGYIYNPEYKSVYCDNEQTQVCAALGKLRRCDTCIIQHQWTGEPFDSLHARNENSQIYSIDGETYKRRRAKNFDMEKMLDAGSQT